MPVVQTSFHSYSQPLLLLFVSTASKSCHHGA